MDLLYRIIYLALVVYTWLIVARALLSWFPLQPGGLAYKLYSAIYDVTEPYLSIFRRFLPTPRVGSVGIDLSAIVGLLVLFVVIQLLQSIRF